MTSTLSENFMNFSNELKTESEEKRKEKKNNLKMIQK